MTKLVAAAVKPRGRRARGRGRALSAAKEVEMLKPNARRSLGYVTNTLIYLVYLKLFDIKIDF